jgi:hypothetical protein
MHALSCKTGWVGTTPAAIHPGLARRTARVSCVPIAKTAENLDLGCRKLSFEEFRMAVDALLSGRCPPPPCRTALESSPVASLSPPRSERERIVPLSVPQVHADLWVMRPRVSGPRQRRPPRSQRWFDLGVAEGLQVAAGVDRDFVGRQVGDVLRPGPTWVGNKTQPSAVVPIPFPAKTPVPRDVFINREPIRPAGVEVVVAVASQNGPGRY